MKDTIQKVVWYKNYESIKVIYEDMQNFIMQGWRVHTCLNKTSDILVIYEMELRGE